MAKYFMAVTIMVCAVLGAALAQEQTPPPKPQEKATQPKQTEKATQPKQTEKAPQAKPDEQKQKTVLAQPAGEVVSIDAMKNELVIKDNAGVQTSLLITASTTITSGGKTITLADIKAGDKITSECEDTTDGFKAKTIIVTPAT
jgi:glucose/arabinose dehydrogenase